MASGKIIGYICVSSFDQNSDRQLNGVKVERVFTDKVSGKNTQRPELEALLNYVWDGETVVVHSLDRLARSLDDLRRLVQSLNRQRCQDPLSQRKPYIHRGRFSHVQPHPFRYGRFRRV